MKKMTRFLREGYKSRDGHGDDGGCVQGGDKDDESGVLLGSKSGGDYMMSEFVSAPVNIKVQSFNDINHMPIEHNHTGHENVMKKDNEKKPMHPMDNSNRDNKQQSKTKGTPWNKEQAKAEKLMRKGGGNSQNELMGMMEAIENNTNCGNLEKKKYRLEVKLVPASCDHDTFELYSKYQRAVHREKPSKISMDGFKRFLVDSPIQVCLRYCSRLC